MSTRFLSWPGAKFHQIPQIIPVLPARGEPWTVVIEPFFGTGAFTWEMIDGHQFFFAAEKDFRLRMWWQNLLLRTDEMVQAMVDVREEFETAGVDRVEFDRLRDTYNIEQVERPNDIRTSAMLWVLVYQSTNNLARFNRSGGYNQTWGKGRKVPDPALVFDGEAKKKLALFSDGAVKSGETILDCDFVTMFESFRKIVEMPSGVPVSDMIAFLDPPYYIRTETYQKGCWTLQDEMDMWEWVEWMDESHIPWVMTNYLRKDDSVKDEVVEHPLIERIRDTWKVLPLDRKIDTRPTGSSTPVEEVMILGHAIADMRGDER